MSRSIKADPVKVVKLDPILEHICLNIIRLDDDYPTVRAMRQNGILSLNDIGEMTPEEIQDLTYTPAGASTPQPLMNAHRSKFRWIRDWNAYLVHETGGDPLTLDQWKDVHKDDYSRFITGMNTGLISMPVKPPPPLPTKPVDLVAEFKKGIKRDASLYPVLKDNKHWNSWQRAVIAQAHAHDIQEVFDVNYVPRNEEQEELFKEKNKFAYAVLNRTVQTDEGKAYVRQHEKDFKANEVYRKLLYFATQSTAAELNKDSLIKYLTTIKLDSRWSGTTVGFILHWSEQMRLLDDMSLMEEQFTPPVRKRMLETAVENIPELANVKEIDTNRIAIGGTPLTFAQYRDTLLSAATRRDERIKPTSTRNKRVVQAHAYDYGDYADDKDDWYEQGYVDTGENYVDTSVNQHTLANRIDQRRRPNTESSAGIRIPKEIWDKLSLDVQDDIKAWNKSKASTYKPKSSPRVVRNHEFSAYEGDIIYIDEQSNDVDADQEPPDAQTDDQRMDQDGANDSTALLAHITGQRPLPANHEIRTLLASAHRSRSANNHAQPPHARKPPPQADNNNNKKHTVVIDGKRYIQADVHRLRYKVASHEKADVKIASLIDRGANGGLAGEDVRLIETTPRTADVSGINDHTIQGLPIATVAGVVDTHLGQVCLIMHQYAYHGKGKTIHSCVQLENFGNDVND